MGERKPTPLKLDPARQIPGVAAGARTILSPDQVQAADEQKAQDSGGGTPEQASGDPPEGGGAGRAETPRGSRPGGTGSPPAHRPARSAETAAGHGALSSPEPSRSGQERPDGRQYQERRTAFARAGFVGSASSGAGGAKPPRLAAEAAGSLQQALGFVREGDPVDPDLEAELYEELRSVGVNPRLYVGQLAEITDAQRRGGVNAYELQYMFADALQQLQALVKRAAASSDLRLREAEDLGPQVFKVVRFLRTSAEHLNEKLSALDTTVDAKREQLLQAFHNDVQSLLGDVSRMDEMLRGSEKLVIERVDAFGAGMQARIVEYLAKVESATEGLHKEAARVRGVPLGQGDRRRTAEVGHRAVQGRLRPSHGSGRRAQEGGRLGELDGSMDGGWRCSGWRPVGRRGRSLPRGHSVAGAAGRGKPALSTNRKLTVLHRSSRFVRAGWRMDELALPAGGAVRR